MCNYPFLILDNRPVAIAKAVAKLFVPFKMKKKKASKHGNNYLSVVRATLISVI